MNVLELAAYENLLDEVIATEKSKGLGSLQSRPLLFFSFHCVRYTH